MDELERRKFEARAEVAKALASPVRLTIVDYLAGGEQCVCNIVKHVGGKQSSVSRHLATLRNAGIVEARKDGFNMYYSLKMPCINSFFNCIDNVIKKQHEESRQVINTL